MLITSLIDTAAPDSKAAVDLLGPDHPLARATDALRGAVSQSLALVIPLSCSGLAAAIGAWWAEALLGATAVVGAVLAARVAILVQVRNGCVVQMLIRSDGEVPLRSVERMRRDLTDPRTRARMAHTLEAIGRGVESTAVHRTSLTGDRPPARRRPSCR
jgi:hypothetical protein